MEYIKISTNEYPITMQDIKREHPNTSFPADINIFSDCIVDFGYAPVFPVEPPVVDYTKNIIKGNPIKTETRYEQTWVVVNASEEEIKERTENKVIEIKKKRNELLQKTDWTQLPDSNVDKDSWVEYRNLLRNIKDQPGFPWEVVWPPTP